MRNFFITFLIAAYFLPGIANIYLNDDYNRQIFDYKSNEEPYIELKSDINIHEEPGSDRGYYYEAPGEGVLRILTYNIRNCIGMDGNTGFDRVADVIKAINLYVVALQEVDSGTRRMEGVDVIFE